MHDVSEFHSNAATKLVTDNEEFVQFEVFVNKQFEILGKIFQRFDLFVVG